MVPLWMFPVAIACGNTFILKPSERDPTLSIRMAELLKEAGLPDGVFNVVHGDKEAVDALLDAPRRQGGLVRGSTPIAKYIYETGARYGKRVQALGGAKNHAVVMPDADLDFAAEALIGAGYGSAGALHGGIRRGRSRRRRDAMGEQLAERALRVAVGSSDAAKVEMGPVITCAARDRIMGYIDRGVEEGASWLSMAAAACCRDTRRDSSSAHALRRRTPSMAIYRDEIFGPVLVVVRAESLADAIALINSNPYANGAALFTRSGHAARRFQQEVDIGMVGVNVPIPVPMAFYSFGGWRSSLFGDLNVHGMDGVRFYTRGKTITAAGPMTAARRRDFTCR